MFSPKLPLFFFLSLFLSGGAIATNCAFTVTITPNPSLTVCSGTTVSLTAASSVAQGGYKYAWTGGGTTSVINVTTSGNYTVTVSNTGCNASDTATASVTLNVNPNASINLTSAAGTNAQTVCVGQSLTDITYAIGGGGTGATFVLPAGVTGNYANGTATISGNPTTAGNYTFTVTTTGTCTQTSRTGTITVNPLPNTPAVTTTNNNSCAGTSLAFHITNIQANVTYAWTFGDGATGNGTNVSHIYSPVNGNGSVNYAATVVATNSITGCSASVSQTVTIKEIPSATLIDVNDPQPFVSCAGANFVLTVADTSTITYSNYSINWGDSTTSYSSSTSPGNGVNHTYSNEGYFTIIYTVTNSAGCTSTSIYQVFNGTNPQIGLANPGGTTGLCTPATISFPINNANNNAPGTIYIVTTNDGSPPDTFSNPPPANFIHTFTSTSCGYNSQNYNNSFYVKIEAINPCNSSAATIEPITLNELPAANFTISPDTLVCTTTSVTFTNTSTGGAYVNNANQCDSTQVIDWVINPIIGVSYPAGSLGNNPPNPNLPSTWGANSFSATFSVPGEYSIKLRIRNKSACGTDSITKTICVQAPPVPSFTASPTSGCAPYIVTLDNTSTGLFQCDSVTRLWTVSQTGSTCIQDSANSFVFISGTNAASVNPIIRFNNQGTYTITLSLTNICGTFTTSPQTITVNRRPTASLASISAICFGDSVTPSLTSSNCGTAITAYSWSFPGAIPSTSSIANPTNINYTVTGTQTISVTVTNSCGTAIATTSVDVLPPPIANAGTDQQICSGNSAQLGAAPVAGLSYQWTPATGLSSSTISNPTVTLTYSGGTTLIQQYILVVINAAGCTDQDTVSVTVYPQATVNAGPSISTCSLLPINLAGTFGGAATSVTWSASVGGGTFTPNVHSATATYTPPNGQSTITLTLTTNDPAGPCPAAGDNMVITFVAPPVANAGPNVQYCSDSSTQIGSTNQAGYTYTWSPSNGLSSTTSSNPIVTLTNNGTTVITQTYTLIVSAQGCSDTAQVVVSVYPPATVNAGAGGAVCAGSSIQLTGTIGGSATAATWSSGQGTFNPTNTLTTTFTPNITSGTATVTLTTNDPVGPCAAEVSTANVTVNPIPVITLPASQTICSGSSTTAVILSSQVGGTTYTWSGNSPNGITGFPANGTASTIPSFIPINGGTAVGTINYSITPTANGCTGTPSTYTFTVNPIPVIASISPQTICSGQTTTAISPTANIAGTSYSWSSSVTGSVTGNTPSGTTSIPLQTLTNSGTIAGTVTYSITPTVNGCLGNPANFVITVNPLPTINAIPPQTICSGQSTTLVTPSSTVTGTTYSWSSSVTGTITGNTSNGTTSIPVQTLTNNGTTSGTVTYTITPTANTCAGPTQSLVVTVNPIPHATATPSVDTICSGDAVNIQLSSTVSGTSFSWTVNAPASITGASNGNGSPIQQTLISTSAAIQTVIYTITPSANNCNGSPITVTVYVNPSADIQFTPTNQNICSGQTTQLVTLSSTTGGATFTWNSQSNGITGVASSGTSTIPQQTLINNTNSPLIATYTTNANFAGCTSQNAVYSFTVNPIPTVTLPANQTVCAGSASAPGILNSPVAGTIYTWSGNSPNGITGFPTTGNTSSIPSFTPNNPNPTVGTINYTIIPTANGCAGTPSNFAFNINPVPVVASIAPQAICSGQSTTLVTPTSTVSGTTYSWSSSITGTITGNTSNGTTTIPSQILTNSGTTAGTVTYSITPTANGCPGTPANFVVTVNPLPNINAIPPQTVCSGQSTTLVTPSSTVSGTTYSWSSSVTGTVAGNTPNGTNNIPVQTLTNGSTTAGTVTYSITPTANTCIGPIQSFTIIVNPIPQATATPTVDTICSGDIINIQLSSTVNGTSFNWTVNAPPSITGASNGTGSSIQQTLTSTSSTRQTVTYSITPSANGCTGSVITVSIVVNPGVTINFSPSPQTICSGQSTQLVTLSSATSGATIAWTSQPNGVGGVALSGTTIIPVQTLTNTTNAPITVIYAATATYVGCTTQAFNYSVVVNPIPMVTNAPLSQTVCSGSSTQQINFTSQVSGATFSWTANSPNAITGFTSTGTSATIPTFVPTNPADTAGTIIITVTPTANNCSGPAATYIITVYPLPDVILPSTQTICNGDTTVSVTPTTNVAGTTFSWT
jgi:PKD repeat protein